MAHKLDIFINQNTVQVRDILRFPDHPPVLLLEFQLVDDKDKTSFFLSVWNKTFAVDVDGERVSRFDSVVCSNDNYKFCPSADMAIQRRILPMNFLDTMRRP